MAPPKRPAPSLGGPAARRMKPDKLEKSVFEEKLASISTEGFQGQSKETLWKRKEITYGKDSNSPIAVQIVDLDYVTGR
uniref:Uncharacterized protein n=1 Tax=Panagrolaimus davidi TaxID=227884 RepID=A0A914PMQ6_9BILA